MIIVDYQNIKIFLNMLNGKATVFLLAVGSIKKDVA